MSNAQDANAYLDQVLTDSAARVPTDSAPDVPADLSKGMTLFLAPMLLSCDCFVVLILPPAGQLNVQSPWFEAYKKEFLRTLAFSDHETFDYPVACKLLAA